MITLGLSKYYSDKGIRDNDKEFYYDNKPLRFLSDIQNVNIIVGANNTRKSRFFKMLMEHESYCIWQSAHDFEEVILQIENGTIDLINNFSGFTFVEFHSNDIEDLDFIVNVREFLKYDTSSKNSRLEVDSLIELLNNITESLLLCVDASQFDSIVKIIKKVIYIIEMVDNLVKDFYVGSESSQVEFERQYVKASTYGFANPRKFKGEKSLKDKEILKILNPILSALKKIETMVDFERVNSDIIYIPVLRTSKTLKGIRDDIFEETIRNQMPRLNSKVTIHTGLTLNDKILKSRNGSKNDFFNFLEFERFISESFFDGKEINIIAQFGNDREIKISLPGERPNVSFNDLGDGVSGIINLLYPIFTANRGSWIFVEEPENNLHPAFQTIFIKTLSENPFIKEKDLKLFINTHSNHILVNSYLASDELNVLVFSKRDEETTSIFCFHDNSKSALDLLGVLNTSVLISNCLIWVEGITDRLYVKAYLKAYLDNLEGINKVIFREGLDYCFIEYGGKNIVHYDFSEIKNGNSSNNVEAFYSNNRILVLADHDNDEIKQNKFSKIKNKHFVYLDTQLPEIENLLPEDILKDFLNYLGVSHEDIAGIKFDQLKNNKMGNIFNGIKKVRRNKALAIRAKHGGTLAPSYKKRLAEFFYEKVQDKTYTWKHLEKSKPIKEITEKIFGFIKKSK